MSTQVSGQRSKTGNPGRDRLRVRQEDLYETPPGAVYALLEVEQLPHHIWEPACGRGAITDILRNHGHTVRATDLTDYGCPDSESRVDFLMETQRSFTTSAIVTNPPYKLADQFVRHALWHCPKAVMLLRLAFLEGTRRSDLVDHALSRVWVFRNRLPRMHRDGWDGPKATSTIAFAWFVFERDHTGPIELGRITRGAERERHQRG